MSLYRTFLMFGIALCSSFGYGLSQAVFNIHQQELSVQDGSYCVSRAEYERLKPGMSVADVEAILGRGVEANQSSTTATFVWPNSGITATFENGKLKSKEQCGLK